MELVHVEDEDCGTAGIDFDGHRHRCGDVGGGVGQQLSAPHADALDDAQHLFHLFVLHTDQQGRVPPQEETSGTGQLRRLHAGVDEGVHQVGRVVIFDYRQHKFHRRHLLLKDVTLGSMTVGSAALYVSLFPFRRRQFFGGMSMRWLGMMAAAFTLAAVILNTIWFARHAGISAGRLWLFSGPTIGYLALFLAGVFLFGWLSARLMAKLDTRDEGAEEAGEAGGAASAEHAGKGPRGGDGGNGS